MNEQAFSTLEYAELCQLVRRGAQTQMGRALAESLQPLGDPASLRASLAAVSEFVELRKRGAAPSFSELVDLSDSLARLKIEGTILEPLTLRELAKLCDQAADARAAVQAERDSSPILWNLVAELPRSMSALAARVTSKILPSGELDDRASPELGRIRSEITRLRSSITRSLESLMRRSEEAVQDQLVTVRNDRFVIPIRSDHRGRVHGVTHGVSSSGQTVFIEPLETIESNNELQQLRETEEREVTRILFTLTEELRAESVALTTAARAVAELDFIGARAAFATQFRCVEPEISEQKSLELVEARHPLLEENLKTLGREVVPVSLSLDSARPVIVISGANAGGKTVVIKTAGLISLMALSGLHVPAASARVPLYLSILADIGDRQSLAANLSTFTSHVSNIRRMIELCEQPALVLLDEVGTGTDPEEGSALGVAVVDHFRRECGAHVIATTHYSGLKMYAANEDGVQNASVEFDERTLEPTYRLIVGVAGSSAGLDIARRFGIPGVVVDAARQFVDEKSLAASEYLRRIKRESEQAEELRRALEEERGAVAEKYAALERTAERRERDRQAEFQRELDKASSEFELRARALYSQLEDRAARTRLEREAEKRAAELRREAQNLRSAAKAATASWQTTASGARVRKPERSERSGTESGSTTAAAREIVVGDHVRLLSLGSEGIVERISGGEAEIRVNKLRFREKVKNLELVTPVQVERNNSLAARLREMQNRGTEVRLSKPLRESYDSELNLIGRTTDEAVDETDKFLDQAYLNGSPQVRIIHGHGTGALRRAVAELLKSHPHVAKFAAAPNDQGGAGATLVELKQ